MQEFIKELRHALNHLSDTGHAALHREIKAAAERHFSGIKDEQIEDWLHTEDMHSTDFPRSKNPKKGDDSFLMSNEDLRADTDRTMFVVIAYLLQQPKYKTRLAAFSKDLSPKLKGLKLTPAFTIHDLDKMPWDAAHVFHTVLAHSFSIMEEPLKHDKILPDRDIDNYLKAVRQMDEYYWTFGGDLFANSLKECNRQLILNYGTLAFIPLNPTIARETLTSPDGGTYTRAELSAALTTHIDELLSSI